MRISATFYNEAGELMAPRPIDVKLANAIPGVTPSIEPGFYHNFKFEGRTQAEYREKSRRFFANMSYVPGYMTLVLREYTVRMGNFVRHGLDVVYVIEAEGGAASAANAPVEPFPGAHRYHRP